MKNILLLLVALFFGMTSMMAQQRLTNSVKVPNIVTKDAIGNNVNLQKLLKENDRVLVCFFRPVWCPICNKHTHELIERYAELKEKGIEVIAIYPSDPELMARYVREAKIPFPVISDPEEIYYKRYAIERSMKKVQATRERPGTKVAFEEGTKLFDGKEYAKETHDRFDAIINADFIIKGKRILEVAYYGEYVGDHYDLDEL